MNLLEFKTESFTGPVCSITLLLIRPLIFAILFIRTLGRQKFPILFALVVFGIEEVFYVVSHDFNFFESDRYGEVFRLSLTAFFVPWVISKIVSSGSRQTKSKDES